ncbi:hypothetical protein COLO4_29634 [Corchorus olitorius]|uniref:Uncharacterized protein n=1 Tax=Corchorus olitorius TaxID=93759 RepID=A0A1R3HDR9_9ROSI|nr:hypothetical protein COLO4_29634 [Corchorus olitorius]
MGEGISTRTQKELAQLQQRHVELSAKVDIGLNQLRSEKSLLKTEIQTKSEQLRSEIEKVSLDLKQFIVECFQKPPAQIDLSSPSKAPGMLGAANFPSTSMSSSDDFPKSNENTRSYTKHLRIEYPHF